MEDYIQMGLQVIEHAPDVLFTSSAFTVAFRAALAALTLVQSDAVFAALDLIRCVVAHDALTPSPGQPPEFVPFAAAIRTTVAQQGLTLTGYLLSGLTGDFPEEALSIVVVIMRMLAAFWPTELLVWLPAVLQQLPAATVPDQAKATFLADITQYVSVTCGIWVGLTFIRSINSKEYDKVKYAVIGLDRASRKARDRRRKAAYES